MKSKPSNPETTLKHLSFRQANRLGMVCLSGLALVLHIQLAHSAPVIEATSSAIIKKSTSPQKHLKIKPAQSGEVLYRRSIHAPPMSIEPAQAEETPPPQAQQIPQETPPSSTPLPSPTRRGMARNIKPNALQIATQQANSAFAAQD